MIDLAESGIDEATLFTKRRPGYKPSKRASLTRNDTPGLMDGGHYDGQPGRKLGEPVVNLADLEDLVPGNVVRRGPSKVMSARRRWRNRSAWSSSRPTPSTISWPVTTPLALKTSQWPASENSNETDMA